MKDAGDSEHAARILPRIAELDPLTLPSFDSCEWFSDGAYYERRRMPLYERYEARWPTLLQGWDLRGSIRIQYERLRRKLP